MGKKWYKRWWAIMLYVIIGIIIISGLVSNSGDSNSSSGTNQIEKEAEFSVIKEDIKSVLNTWSNDLPSEYILGEISSYCNQNQNTNCERINILDSSSIIEGYSISFSETTGDSGEGSIYIFDTEDEAKLEYEKIIESIKSERGYKEIKVSGNCFGWEQDVSFITVQNIICYKLNSIYQVSLKGMLMIGNSDIKEFSKQLGKELV